MRGRLSGTGPRRRARHPVHHAPPARTTLRTARKRGRDVVQGGVLRGLAPLRPIPTPGGMTAHPERPGGPSRDAARRGRGRPMAGRDLEGRVFRRRASCGGAGGPRGASPGGAGRRRRTPPGRAGRPIAGRHPERSRNTRPSRHRPPPDGPPPSSPVPPQGTHRTCRSPPGGHGGRRSVGSGGRRPVLVPGVGGACWYGAGLAQPHGPGGAVPGDRPT